MPSNKYENKDNDEKNDPQQQNYKQVIFQALHCLHRSNESIHNVFYYILMLIQFLQIFFYVTHPLLPYYRQSLIMINIHRFLKYLVFNEFLTNESDFYKIMLPLCFSYVVVQVISILVIVSEIKKKKLINQVRKIHFVTNIMFLIFNSILTIPFFGLSLNVLYCDPLQNRYTLGQQCYTGTHIGYCFLAALVILSIVVQWGINWYIYYNKNPFATDFLAKYENNAILGKFLIKIIPIIYVAIDFNMAFIDVFSFGIAGCICGYIFFFRIFAIHDYNQSNFYFVLFLQVVLGWFSINNIILSYLDSQKKAGGLFESFLCSLIVGALVIQIQAQSYKKIFMEGMQADKVKKQNIQKFIYRLIYMLHHSPSQNQKNHLSTIIKILNSKFKETQSMTVEASKANKKVEQKFYSFLSNFLAGYPELNSNVMLMAVNCNLFILQERFSYAFHQSLQLSNKKISVIEELMMYRFRRHTRYDKQKLDTTRKENNNIFMMYYDFNQNLMKLEEQIAVCAFNNLDYWQQVCEASPSIYKIRNLAQRYEKLQHMIDIHYNNIYQIFPNNKLGLKIYIQFLMYVGVNIKSLSKAKQRYEQAEQNIKKTKQLQKDSDNLIQMGENQNLAYISIETNQMALGTITNCNSEFKKMLGYEKNELIDKKVNKIMPKSFTQFHDDVVRNYIHRRQYNQKNKVERIVFALSKDNFIVQVVLFTKINFKTIGQRPKLELIGFLKKIQDPNKAVIILEMRSKNIVGANVGFSTLIEDGISSCEFANSQIKISTLLPTLDQSLIEQGTSQQTYIIFSSSSIVTKSGLNLQVKKKVLIQVEQVRDYSGKQKFAYLVIKEVYSQQNVVRTEGRIRLPTIQAEVLKNKLREISVKKSYKQPGRKVRLLGSQVSIMQEANNNSMNTIQRQTLKPDPVSSDKQRQVFHIMERKKQQFLKNQHLDIFRYILWFTQILFICITIGVFIYSSIQNQKLIDESFQIKNQIKNTYVITYQTAQINKNIEKIMQGKQYSQEQFAQISKDLSSSVANFQANFIPLMTMSVSYDFPLQLNQFRYYNIVIQNQNGRSEYAQESIIDAFFQYISSSKNFASYTLADLSTEAIHEMAQENVFIQQNGKQLFPSISKKMAFEYLNLDRYLYDQHQIHQLVMTVSYAVNLVIALLVIAILVRKINTFNQRVVLLYNQIKLWDATEMKNKCIMFIQKTTAANLKALSKKRLSSLLNVFPQQAFLRVLSAMSNNQQSSARNLHNSNGEDQELLRSQNNQSQGMREAVIGRTSEKARKFYVLLSQKNKLKRKFFLFGSFAALFIGAYFIKHFYSHDFQSQILYYNKRISQLGRVRDNLSFMNYYTYQIMLKPTDPVFRRLLQTQIAEFYQNTDACYDLIGDPSTILKDSYNLVEEVAALIYSTTLNIQDSERYSIKNKKYLVQELLFDKNIQEISKMIDRDQSEKNQQLFDSIKTLNIAFSLSFVFLTIIFAILIKCWMLEEILRNSKKSKSMVLMLPPWLIERNKGISAILQ